MVQRPLASRIAKLTNVHFKNVTPAMETTLNGTAAAKNDNSVSEANGAMKNTNIHRLTERAAKTEGCCLAHFQTAELFTGVFTPGRAVEQKR